MSYPIPPFNAYGSLILVRGIEATWYVYSVGSLQSLMDENMEHDYWAESQASVNPDFTRILFTRNWGRSGTGEVEM